MTYTNNYSIIFLSLFVFSLPFNGAELDIIGIDRFEIKITMITFILLTIIWIGTIKKYGINYKNYEVVIYAFLMIYICTQYISIATSNQKIYSLQQSIIITLFVFIMLVISQLITSLKIAHYVIISMGITCVSFSIVKLVVFIYFSDVVRLGQAGENALINNIFRGDPTYFGDIVLLGLGSFYYLIITFCRKPATLIFTIPFQIIIFSFVVSTQSKGVMLSLMLFLGLSLVFLKGWRIFMILSSILFFSILFIFATTDIKELLSISPKYEFVNRLQPNENIHAWFFSEDKEKLLDINNKNEEQSNIQSTKLIDEYDDLVEKINNSRINPISTLGMSSYDSRLKAIKVSMFHSFKQLLFGHGAGTSQKLLPKMIDQYVLNYEVKNSLVGAVEKEKIAILQYKYYTGASFQKWIDRTINNINNPNYQHRSMIDAHNIFITELFNVGLVGVLALFIAIVIIIYKQYQVIRINKYKDNYMNELLLLTLISMLMNRMTDSLIAIPFLWVILGINLGLIKLRTGNS